MWVPCHFPANISDICCPQMASPWPHTKSKIIQDWLEPRKSRMFNPSLVLPTSTIVSFKDIPKSLFHLCCLTHKGTPWHFSDECHSAFEALKKGFHHSSIPYPWILDTQITVETDASNYALAAVLFNHDSKWWIVSNCIPLPDVFSSGTQLWCPQQRATHRFLKLFKWWQHYLESSGLPIDVVTNHQNLQYFSTTKNPHASTSTLVWISFWLNLIIHFHPRKLWNQTWHSLDNGMSILKRGIVTMPASNTQNYCLVFTSEQLASSFLATTLINPSPPWISHHGCWKAHSNI